MNSSTLDADIVAMRSTSTFLLSWHECGFSDSPLASCGYQVQRLAWHVLGASSLLSGIVVRDLLDAVVEGWAVRNSDRRWRTGLEVQGRSDTVAGVTMCRIVAKPSSLARVLDATSTWDTGHLESNQIQSGPSLLQDHGTRHPRPHHDHPLLIQCAIRVPILWF